METIRFRKTNQCFKPLHATNGGPWHRRYCNDQWRSNMQDYTRAGFPFSRCHDSNLSGSTYGGPFSYDISVIFPDFDADENDPASYDFDCTDESILTTLDAGTETFFRLGQSIEHQIKKHDTLAPRDFQKWARICEHVIRHLNEGWGKNGLKLNIRYWEIWNEPDLCPDNSPEKRLRTWGGTKEQFFEFYAAAACHLKKCFPHLKIGGPALAGDMDWAEEFLSCMEEKKVPMDFFSWHIYCREPEEMTRLSVTVRAMMDRHGYREAESILNEWNYVEGWTDQFLYTIRQIHGIKGAAFVMACMSACQKAPVDMLMYYDTRPSAFCGVFDYYTYEKLKGYYPFFWFNQLYRSCREMQAENLPEHLYALCGQKEDGKKLALFTCYRDEDGTPDMKFSVELPGEYRVHLLDRDHDGDVIFTGKVHEMTMTCPSVLFLEEI